MKGKNQIVPRWLPWILALAIFALPGWPQVAPTEPPKAESAKLPTHYFRLSKSVWGPEEDEPHYFSVITDGTEKDPLTRTRNAEQFFKDRGVIFPAGASAIYHEAAGVLAITNRPDQLVKAAAFIQEVYGPQTRQLQCSARIVEYLPEWEDQLGGRQTFAALQKKLGDGLKTVCVSTVTTKSGSRTYGELDHGGKLAAKTAKGGKSDKPPRLADEAPDWPPPPGVERAIFECEPTLGPSETGIDLNFSLRYATPASAQRPAIVSTFASNLVLKPGVLFKARTFTVADPKQEAPRYFAILLQCELFDEFGRSTEQARETLRKAGQ